MSGRSAKNNNRGSDLFGYFVSGKYKEFHTNQFAGAVTLSGLTATGGVISDYTDGSTVYRAHIFTSSGTFDVTALGSFGGTVDYLVVAGGGSGTSYRSGGGGAGGLRTSMPGIQDAAANPLTASSYTVSVSNYTVTVGGGGASPGPGNYTGNDGSHTEFYPTPIGPQHPNGLISHGGGGAMGAATGASRNGGSGAGGDWFSYSGAGSGNTPPFTPPQGNPGGVNPLNSASVQGGGGGAGEPGYDGGPDTLSPATKGRGGDGVEVLIAGPAVSTGAPGPGTPFGWFAGGGGAGRDSNDAGAPGGYGGGGIGGTPTPFANRSGTTNSGGGGGGGSGDAAGNLGGSGGSGIVVVRYRIAELTAEAKATGGAISYYGGKTIHTFTSTANFTTPGSFSETVEYLVVGGGGAGGSGARAGGGGGAGRFATGTTPVGSSQNFAMTIGAGGVAKIGPSENPTSNGNPGTQTTAAFPAGTITSGGGGGGGAYQQNGEAGSPNNASGGGGGRDGSSGGPSGTDPGGNPGGTGGPGTSYGGAGGGGGSGGAGGNASNPGSSTETSGHGGVGTQAPSTFRDPTSGVGAPGPNSEGYWFAGGGGGACSRTAGIGEGGGPGGPYAGGGKGQYEGGPSPDPIARQVHGLENTGGGGGGGGYDNDPGYSAAGHGGSGIVIIAYPT